MRLLSLALTGWLDGHRSSLIGSTQRATGTAGSAAFFAAFFSGALVAFLATFLAGAAGGAGSRVGGGAVSVAPRRDCMALTTANATPRTRPVQSPSRNERRIIESLP